MFILRVYTAKEKVESNTILGKSYNLVRKTENPIEFERILNDLFSRLNEDVIYAFIIYDQGAEFRPLYKDQHNYVMTDSGKTFSNVSER